jgi:ABC-type polysaccharide/polyol phosphate transport system ATPase subunit
MHLDPEVLLLDEVLAVGDEGFRQKSMDAMHELLDRAGTIVFVSHSLPSVETFCDRAIWLEKGKISAEGPSVDVVAAYRESVADHQAGQG